MYICCVLEHYEDQTIICTVDKKGYIIKGSTKQVLEKINENK